MNRNEISETLSAASATFDLLRLDESEILILPFGGRVLGLFASGAGNNFFWVNSSFGSPDSARVLLADPEWCNSGGDRTWLAPEIDVFFPQFPDLSVYRVPFELDPGHYEIIHENSKYTLRNEFQIRLSRSGRTGSGRIIKTWAAAPNPLRYESLDLEVEFAGYTQRTDLTVDEGVKSAGIWNLLQLPPGGTALVPVYSHIQPHIYVGTVESGELHTSGSLIRYSSNRIGIKKLGIPSAFSTGRLGYIHKTDKAFELIIRNFFSVPSGEYIDVPWTDSGETGLPKYGTQICFVKSRLGDYVELEYHTPRFMDMPLSCEDVSQVWAYRGSAEAIRKVASQLLANDFESEELAHIFV